MSQDSYAEIRSLPLLAVLSHLGFTEWKARKQNTEWAGPCPSCKPKHNKGNFSFDLAGKFNCFSGCGLKGKGAIDLFQKITKCGFKESVEALKALGTTIPAEQPKAQVPAENLTVSENKPYEGKYEKFYQPCEWLRARGLTQETLDRYGVGLYSNPARKSAYTGKVMFPIYRLDGTKVGYLARTIEPAGGEPKYQFAKGFVKSLEVWGAFQIKEKPVRVLYLVESPLCAMKFSQYGLSAISTFGFSVSEHQAAIIAQLTRGLVYLCDRNKRDQIAGCIELLSRVVWTKAPALPDGCEDPESLGLNQIQSLT